MTGPPIPEHRKGSVPPTGSYNDDGFGGGPKRWTGKGPAPARHIPWLEVILLRVPFTIKLRAKVVVQIFDHHISVVEGHLRMMEMVVKHTVEGAGDHRMVMGCVERAKEILAASKHVAGSFVRCFLTRMPRASPNAALPS